MKGYGLASIKEVVTIANRKNVRIGEYLIDLKRAAFLVNITLFISKKMSNVTRRSSNRQGKLPRHMRKDNTRLSLQIFAYISFHLLLYFCELFPRTLKSIFLMSLLNKHSSYSIVLLSPYFCTFTI
jgi:hypothetical protein